MDLTRLHNDENNILSFQQNAMNDSNQKTVCVQSQVQMICKNESQGYGSPLPGVAAEMQQEWCYQEKENIVWKQQI